MSATNTSRRALLGDPANAALKAIRDSCISDDPAPTPSLETHAIHRLTFGPRPGDLAYLTSRGYEVWLDEQLSPATIDDSAAEAVLALLPQDTLAETPAQLYDRRSAGGGEASRPLTEITHLTWARMIHSRRQLFERVVNFWHEHFNVLGTQFIVRSMFPGWDALIREHALGNFRAFLEATAQHPCMLYYLDNYLNSNSGPNENYARELFELHTLGAENYRPDIAEAPTCDSTNDADGDGVRDYYIDNDVYEAARCFTGWTYTESGTDPNRGQFFYNGTRHDRFNKLVLCSYLPPDLPQLEDGRRVLDLLALHPGTARHICRKLCTRFVSDTPPESLVLAAAKVFTDNWNQPDQLRRVLRFILTSAEFRNSRMAKIKRPLEWAVSAMRALNIPYIVHNNFNISWIYDAMGQPMFGWRPPDGPPDTAQYWSTSNGLLRRWNFVYMTVSGWYNSQGHNFSTDGIRPAELRTSAQIAQFWSDRLIGRSVSAPTRTALQEFVAEGRKPTIPLSNEQIADKERYLAALCTMTPEFMRH